MSAAETCGDCQIKEVYLKMAESIAVIRERFARATEKETAELIRELEADSRSGVRNLAAKAQKQLEKLAAERARLDQMRVYERQYGSEGLVCGVDEAGRGPLAGPVVAGAVILPPDCEILYLNDSKKLTAARREALYDEITEKALAWGVGIIGPQRIDEINILQADYEAMCEALGKLSVMPRVLLNDAVTIPQVKIKQVPIIKGDAKSVSIAAASILAKVTRDRIMTEYAELFPAYGFERNKGYGSAEHIEALKHKGPCQIHRRTFITHFV